MLFKEGKLGEMVGRKEGNRTLSRTQELPVQSIKGRNLCTSKLTSGSLGFILLWPGK